MPAKGLSRGRSNLAKEIVDLRADGPRRWSTQEEMRRRNLSVHFPDIWGSLCHYFIRLVEPFPFEQPARELAGKRRKWNRRSQ